MLYQLYKKQVEVWKEGWREYSQGEIVDPEPFMLSSRHKDTIELLEAEIKRKKGMRKELQPIEWMNWERGYNSAIDEDIAYLEETVQKIKNEI